MDLSIFREYDIRGVYPTQINEGTVYKIARNFGKFYKKGSIIVVGHDARVHSGVLYKSLKMGLLVAGMHIISADLITTPMLAFIIRKNRADGGVMVTASHNPAEYNGLKISNKLGGAISGKTILKKIGKKNLLSVVDVSRMISAPLKSNYKKHDYIKEYVEFLSKKLSPEHNIRVVLDSSQGSAGPIIQEIADINKNINFSLLNSVPDGTFCVHGPDPDEKGALKEASDVVVSESADLGVVFDADGDRAIFIDELGRKIRPEYVWRLITTYLNVDECVYDVSSIFFMDKLLKGIKDKNDLTIKGHSVRVGRSFMQNAIKKYDAKIGFEHSGHYYFKDFWGLDSGIITAIYVINAFSKLPYSLSKFIELLPQTHRSDEINIPLLDVNINRIFDTIKSKYKSKANSILTNDGISVDLGRVWFNLRESNTQNILRLNIDGETEKDVERIKRDLSPILKKIS